MNIQAFLSKRTYGSIHYLFTSKGYSENEVSIFLRHLNSEMSSMLFRGLNQADVLDVDSLSSYISDRVVKSNYRLKRYSRFSSKDLFELSGMIMEILLGLIEFTRAFLGNTDIRITDLTITKLSTGDYKLSVAIDDDVVTEKYFHSEIHRLIFTLLHMDGKSRMDALEVRRVHYCDEKKAKLWYKKLANKVHPDKCTHPKAAEAFAALNELYNRMTYK